MDDTREIIDIIKSRASVCLGTFLVQIVQPNNAIFFVSRIKRTRIPRLVVKGFTRTGHVLHFGWIGCSTQSMPFLMHLLHGLCSSQERCDFRHDKLDEIKGMFHHIPRLVCLFSSWDLARGSARRLGLCKVRGLCSRECDM
jgi:hypothetical protein